MNVYDITLECDHKMLVLAFDEGDAREIATKEAATHNTTVETVEQIHLDQQGLLAWYPGPFSEDAIIDREGDIG